MYIYWKWVVGESNVVRHRKSLKRPMLSLSLYIYRLSFTVFSPRFNPSNETLCTDRYTKGFSRMMIPSRPTRSDSEGYFSEYGGYGRDRCHPVRFLYSIRLDPAYYLIDTVNKKHKHCIIMGDMNIDLLKFETHFKTSDFKKVFYQQLSNLRE